MLRPIATTQPIDAQNMSRKCHVCQTQNVHRSVVACAWHRLLLPAPGPGDMNDASRRASALAGAAAAAGSVGLKRSLNAEAHLPRQYKKEGLLALCRRLRPHLHENSIYMFR